MNQLRHLGFGSAIILLFFTDLPLFSQQKIACKIGDVKVTQNVLYKNRLSVQIEVYDVTVNNAKGKSVYFAYYIAQDAKWIQGTYISQQPQTVGFDSSNWKGPQTFCFYLDFLEKNSDIGKPYVGTFFIKEAGTNTTLGRKNTDFTVSKNETPANTNTGEEDTAAASGDDPGTKTLFDYWSENVPPLKKNPEPAMDKAGYKLDPRIPGTWKCYFPISDEMGYWENTLTYSGDGTANIEKIPWFFDPEQKIFVKSDPTAFTFKWGIAVTKDTKGRPVTFITWTFDDGSLALLYYALPDDGSLVQIVFDQTEQIIGEGYVYYADKVFTERTAGLLTEIEGAVTGKVPRECDRMVKELVEGVK